MVPNAADGPHGVSAFLARQLAPAPHRFAFAAKLGLLCAITAGATALYRTPEPALAAYIVFFVNSRDRVSSLLIELLLTVIFGALLLFVLVVAMFVLDYPAWRVATIALISFGLLFLGSASKIKPLAGTFGLIVGYALDKLGNVQVGEAATRGLLYAWLFVALPAQVSIVFNVIAGRRPRRLATAEIARRLRLCAKLLEAPSDLVRLEVQRSLQDGGAELTKWLKLAKTELGEAPADLAHLNRGAYSTLEILARTQLLDQVGGLPTDVARPIAQTLDAMAEILDAGGYPVDIVLMPAHWADAAPLAIETADNLRRSILAFAEIKSEPPTAVIKPPTKSGFLAADAFSNPRHLQYAFKITTAAVFCYLLYSILNWPGIHTCFLTCYIVGLGTVAESVEKLALRLSGAIVGAIGGVLTLLFVMPHITSVGGLAVIIFIGAAVAGYVAAGSPRISYVGFQMAFAFFLCTLEGSAPNFDMKTIRDRLIGIAIGNIVIYLVSTRLWPTSVVSQIESAVIGALRTLSASLRALTHGARAESAASFYGTLEKLETDLELAAYEPPPVRAPSPWLESRRAAVHDLVQLQTVVLAAGGLERPVELSERLDRLADQLSTPTPPIGPSSAVTSGRPQHASLGALLEQTLQHLEVALTRPADGERHGA